MDLDTNKSSETIRSGTPPPFLSRTHSYMHTTTTIAAVQTRNDLIAAICFFQGSLGFFHPFADDGGGGERVLW